MVKNLVRALTLAAGLGLAVAAPAVAANPALASSSAPAVSAPAAAPASVVKHSVVVRTAHGAHGTVKVHTYSKRAGSCSIYVDWTARYGSQNTGVLSEVWVKPYIDECSGGGTLKFRAEMICTSDSGALHYYYGVWNNGAGNTSYVDQAWYCWEDIGVHNGSPTVAAFQENENNPTRITCASQIFFGSDRKASGSNCGTTT